MDDRKRRLAGTLGTVLVLASLGFVVKGATPPAPSAAILAPMHAPALVFDDSVDADFQALARQTWARFLGVFQVRSHCFGDVRLQADYVLGSRAGYDPDTATVTVHVPGTPARLQSALVHEWAHHVEFQCEEHQTLRAAFLAAQGLPPDTPWRPQTMLANAPASEWAAVPSEQYAEATVELVLGGRPLSTAANYTLDAVRVVEAWAAGD